MEYIQLYQIILGDAGKRSGKKIAFPCWRCDRDRPGKRHLYVNPATGRYKCYKCGFDADGLGSGTARFFAHMMGYTGLMPDEGTMKNYKGPKNNFNQEKASQVYTFLWQNMPLLPEHREAVMTGRGIKNPEAFGLKSLIGAEKLLRDHFYRDMLLASGLFFEHDGRVIAHKTIYEGRLLIPYMTRQKEVYFVKSRRMKDDNSLKYASPIDALGSTRIWGHLIPGATTLVVTEGEFKAMASVEAKVLTMSLPGITSSHHTLVEMLKESGITHLIICFDTQITDAEDVDKAAIALASRILRETDIIVGRAHLPLEPWVNKGEKMDIDTYLYYHTAREYHDVLRKSEKILIKK